MRAGGGTRRSTARLAMVLPLPDSPTRPSVSRGRMVKSMPSTTGATPDRVKKCTRSPSTGQQVGHCFRRGLNASDRPSANRLKPSTVMKIAPPGASTAQGETFST